MEDVFADTNYWVAKIFPDDQWHERVIDVEYEIGIVTLVTIEAVLIETLNYFSDFRQDVKETAYLAIKSIVESDEVSVISQSNEIFQNGIEFYGKRLDKGYSLTDCVSINVCREREIREVLTRDNHFTQEGFTVLL